MRGLKPPPPSILGLSAACLAKDGVVDEAGGAKPGGYGEEGAGGCDFHGLQGGPVDGFDVIDADGRLGSEGLAGGGDQGGGAAFSGSGEGCGLVDGSAERQGLGALRGTEIDVAGAESQAVGLADDGANHDFCGQAEVCEHAAEDGDLGGIFLAEEGAVGLGGDEELGYDGGNAAEMAGAGGAVKAGA